jgi:hypothetical protein
MLARLCRRNYRMPLACACLFNCRDHSEMKTSDISDFLILQHLMHEGDSDGILVEHRTTIEHFGVSLIFRLTLPRRSSYNRPGLAQCVWKNTRASATLREEITSS